MSADGSSPIRLPLTGKTIRAADLFCGAGGTSTGARRAIHQLGGKLKLVAINHWQTAIDTHTRMHPEATHLCADLEHVRPRQAVPGGVLDLLMASPTCTYHSRARGGRPVHDQQRMDPWHVVRWCSDLRVHRLLVENVPEMVDWGACDARTGKPIKSKKGAYFQAWLQALESIGFRVDWRIINCANYGDATTRQRFFLIARSDRKPLRWPEPTHADGGASDLLGTRAPWRPAADIIDWSNLGKSIFTRRKPLAPNTLQRLHAGARRNHWPRQHVDALRALLDGAKPRLDVTMSEAEEIAERLGLPLVMATGAGGAARGVDEPIPTVTGGGDGGARPHFAAPIIMHRCNSDGGRGSRPVTEPAPTATTGGAGYLAQPLIAPYYGGGSGLTATGADTPVPAVTTKARFGLSTPVLIQTDQTGSNGRCARDPVDQPIPTLHTKANLGLARPIIVPSFGEAPGQEPRWHSIDAPAPAITATGHQQLASPVLVGYAIDILYRMLHWRELARGMSFDDEGEVYDFAGTSTEITKQIGNAVPGRTAKALVRALLEA